jgi:hypothetical protein
MTTGEQLGGDEADYQAIADMALLINSGVQAAFRIYRRNQALLGGDQGLISQRRNLEHVAYYSGSQPKILKLPKVIQLIKDAQRCQAEAADAYKKGVEESADHFYAHPAAYLRMAAEEAKKPDSGITNFKGGLKLVDICDDGIDRLASPNEDLGPLVGASPDLKVVS